MLVLSATHVATCFSNQWGAYVALFPLGVMKNITEQYYTVQQSLYDDIGVM
jgi:hypothetical protein